MRDFFLNSDGLCKDLAFNSQISKLPVESKIPHFVTLKGFVASVSSFTFSAVRLENLRWAPCEFMEGLILCKIFEILSCSQAPTDDSGSSTMEYKPDPKKAKAGGAASKAKVWGFQTYD